MDYESAHQCPCSSSRTISSQPQRPTLLVGHLFIHRTYPRTSCQNLRGWALEPLSFFWLWQWVQGISGFRENIPAPAVTGRGDHGERRQEHALCSTLNMGGICNIFHRWTYPLTLQTQLCHWLLLLFLFASAYWTREMDNQQDPIFPDRTLEKDLQILPCLTVLCWCHSHGADLPNGFHFYTVQNLIAKSLVRGSCFQISPHTYCMSRRTFIWWSTWHTHHWSSDALGFLIGYSTFKSLLSNPPLA